MFALIVMIARIVFVVDFQLIRVCISLIQRPDRTIRSIDLTGNSNLELIMGTRDIDKSNTSLESSQTPMHKVQLVNSLKSLSSQERNTRGETQIATIGQSMPDEYLMKNISLESKLTRRKRPTRSYRDSSEVWHQANISNSCDSQPGKVVKPSEGFYLTQPIVSNAEKVVRNFSLGARPQSVDETQVLNRAAKLEIISEIGEIQSGQKNSPIIGSDRAHRIRSIHKQQPKIVSHLSHQSPAEYDSPPTFEVIHKNESERTKFSRNAELKYRAHLKHLNANAISMIDHQEAKAKSLIDREDSKVKKQTAEKQLQDYLAQKLRSSSILTSDSDDDYNQTRRKILNAKVGVVTPSKLPAIHENEEASNNFSINQRKLSLSMTNLLDINDQETVLKNIEQSDEIDREMTFKDLHRVTKTDRQANDYSNL